MLDDIFIPNGHIDIAIKITTRHFMLIRPLPLGGKHDDIYIVSSKLFEPRIIRTHCFQQPDIAWVTARVLSDNDISRHSIRFLLGLLTQCLINNFFLLLILNSLRHFLGISVLLITCLVGLYEDLSLPKNAPIIAYPY
jgi:hypothetical protein